MKRAFSLIELLMAIFILGIGLISIAALFPAGIALQQRSEDEFNGPLVADWAMGQLRDRLRVDDFGTWWHFLEWSAQIDGEDPMVYEQVARAQLENDRSWHPAAWLNHDQWPWLRPAMVIEADDPDMIGAIDIFNATGADFGASQATTTTLGEHTAIETHGYDRFLSLDPWSSSMDDEVTVGIPFNALKHTRPPRVLVMPHERAWPPADSQGTVPKYFWDCAFRRNADGRVQVAIFVYRATRTSLSAPGWRPQPMLDANDNLVASVPYRLRIRDLTDYNWPGWPAGLRGDEADAFSAANLAGLPGLPDVTTDVNDITAGWQRPRQWLLDQVGTVHRVIAGRSVAGSSDPVVLSTAIPEPVVSVAIDDADHEGDNIPGNSRMFTASQYVPSCAMSYGRERDWPTGVLRAWDYNDIANGDDPTIEPWSGLGGWNSTDPPAVSTLWYVPPVVKTESGETYELDPVYVSVEDL